MASESISFAFYCSGHGFGHATRVSALTTSLLAAGHSVSIVTNAPTIPFAAVLPPSTLPSPDLAAPPPVQLPRYATYRKRNVDAGIVQPKAYDVDRKATYEVLKAFMEGREQTIKDEVEWLKSEGVQCVLSDATFLGCAAAAGAGIPAIIVSNFTFDSCYSYLSHPSLPSLFPSPTSAEIIEPPLPASLIDPLVNQSIADYRHASLLLRLPGAIPIPAFDTDAPHPSGSWVTSDRSSFTPEMLDLLSRPLNTIPRKVVDVPLIVRAPSPDVYSPEFRANLLSGMGVPEHLQGSKILLVSFGGQSIPRPRSRPPSPLSTPLVRSSSRQSLGVGTSHSLLEIPDEKREAGLLPKGWIAIVCGLSGNNNEIRNDLPEGFFASDKDVYVPDLTATADVVLGKLGYGTCSETISCSTPFIYVPRPLFIEELGLKRLMNHRGTALELSREDFEAGRWEWHVEEAWELGREGKELQRREGWKDEGAGEVIRGEIEKFLRERREEGFVDEGVV